MHRNEIDRKKPRDRSSLTWKLEEPAATGSSEDDVGPAWVDSDRGGSPPGGAVSGGRWMTRREARAIAEEHALTFIEDDGVVRSRAPQTQSSLDVDAINRKLRAAGVTESELRLEESGLGDVLVWGTLLQCLPDVADDPDSPFTTEMVTMLPAEALDALDQLVPEWRSFE